MTAFLLINKIFSRKNIKMKWLCCYCILLQIESCIKFTFFLCLIYEKLYLQTHLRIFLNEKRMDDVAQLVRALDCGSRGRGFDPHHCPNNKPSKFLDGFFVFK